MKKSDIRNITLVLESLPIKECEDRELKIQLIHDRVCLKRYDQEILSDVASLREEIIGDKQDKVNEYYQLGQEGKIEEAKALEPEVKDAILDFSRANDGLMNQDVEVNLPYKIEGRKLVEFIVDHAPEAVDDIDKLIPIMT